ncbi:MAG TPA: ABC transporter ATP-binding protein [Mariprofundaceae bacterium]|nr:ABC transporter ATP-binding protein [Mariprofundaceae bacterium]
MLKIQDLSLAISGESGSVPAVTNISLDLEPGKVLGLVGESGCGKSLTAQSILRLGEHQGIRRTAGTIRLDGEDIFTMPEKRLRRLRGGTVSMVFQEPMTALNPVFSIGSQLIEVIQLHLKLGKGEARQRAIGLLGDVGLQNAEGLLDQYPDALSGGMRQRVLIAMAMAGEPDYIIADEPTTALDVSVQKRIIGLLRYLQQTRGLGMLLVTHDFGLVAELADSVAVMYAGHIVEYGTVAEIFDHPAHPYTRALMACRPEVAPRHAAFPVIAGQVPSPGQWPDGCRFASRCRWADTACKRPVAEDVWHEDTHRARCVHVERVRQASRDSKGVSA